MAGEFFVSNLVGDFDYNQILQQMQSVKSLKVSFLQQKEQQLEQKKSAISNFGSLADELKSIADELTGTSLFDNKSVTASDDSVLSLSVTDPSKASAANLDIQVNQLARNDVWLSQSGTADKSSAAAAAGGTLQLTFGGEVVATIDYDTDAADAANPSTLQEIADAVNSRQDSVTASIFYDGSSYRLLLSSKETGSANSVGITETGGGDLLDRLQLGDNYAASHVKSAQNAQIEIYGQTVESETNGFADVLEGVSISVHSPSASAVNVVITGDLEPAKEKLGEFVAKYNGMVDFVKEKTGEGGALSGEYSLQQIRSSIFSKIAPLFELGIADVDRDTGHISIDETKLDSKMASDLGGVKTKIAELENGLTDYLVLLTGSEGTIKLKEKSFDQQIRRMEDSIAYTAERVNAEIETLRKEFVNLQKLMAKMQGIGSRIESTFQGGSMQ